MCELSPDSPLNSGARFVQTMRVALTEGTYSVRWSPSVGKFKPAKGGPADTGRLCFPCSRHGRSNPARNEAQNAESAPVYGYTFPNRPVESPKRSRSVAPA
jgi:hypothetical protein